jgi:hypothetical protein
MDSRRETSIGWWSTWGSRGRPGTASHALCRGLDEQVVLPRQRPLEGAYPYVWLDAILSRRVLIRVAVSLGS